MNTRKKLFKSFFFCWLFIGIPVHIGKTPEESMITCFLCHLKIRDAAVSYTHLANQPVSYMNLAFTVLVLTLVITIRLLIKRTDLKKTVSALAVGGCLTALIVAGYFVNCNFTASAMEDRAVLDHFFYKTSDEKLNEKYDENETKEIIRLCKQLKPVSENEQRKLEKNYRKNGESSDVVSITVIYEESFGQNLDININIDGNKIYVDKGTGLHDKEVVVFFKDNGLTKYFR